MLFCCFAHHASYTSVTSKKIYVYTKAQIGLEGEGGVMGAGFLILSYFNFWKDKIPFSVK